MSFRTSKNIIILSLLLLTFFLQGLWFINNTSATFDEPVHIPAGWSYWKYNDFRLNPEHPPLIKYWCTIPLLFMNLHSEQTEYWEKAAEWEYGFHFIYDWNKDKPVLFYSRLMNLLLGVIFGLVLWFFTREVAGEKAAHLALTFFSFNPEIITHSSLVTTDSGIALFYLLSIYGLFVFSKGRYLKGILLLISGIAGGILTKYSFIVVLPFIVIWFLISLYKNRKALTQKNFRKIILGTCIIIISVYCLIWITYGLKYKSIPQGVDYNTRWESIKLKGAAGKVIAYASKYKILPEAYVYGTNYVLINEVRPTYIWGNILPRGVWYYFPSTFVLKTPLTLLVVLLVTVCFALRKSIDTHKNKIKRNISQNRNLKKIEVSIPPIIFGALLYYFLYFILFVRLNIGNRHILPVYSYVFIIAAIGLSALIKFRKGKIIITGILLMYVLSVLNAAPHYLSFVNIIGGGNKNGWKYLADSNYDWGQDLKKLKEWSDENGKPEIKLAYFGNNDINATGLNYTLIPAFRLSRFTNSKIEENLLKIPIKGYFAISTTHLVGVNLEEYFFGFNPYEYFKERQPIATAGNSIRIYKEDQPDSLTLVDACMDILKRKIEKDPDNGNLYAMLASAMMYRKYPFNDVISMFKKAIEKDPKNTSNYMVLADIFKNIQQYDMAEKLYNTVLDIDDENHFAWNNLGDIYLKRNEYDKAIHCFQKAIEITPLFFQAWNNLAITALKNGNQKLMEDAISELQKIQQDSYLIDNIWGQYYNKKGDMKKAKMYFESSCKKNPYYASGFNNVGVVFFNEGNFVEAAKNFEKACSLDPKNQIYKENYLSATASAKSTCR